MSWSCDWDGPEVYSEGEVVARKEHGCVECNAPILPGECHLRYSGLWDGAWGGGRQHLLCRDACVWIRDVLEGECIAFGELGEWWAEHGNSWDVVPGNAPSDVALRARAAWRRGARMYAMIRRRQRLARQAKREAA